MISYGGRVLKHMERKHCYTPLSHQSVSLLQFLFLHFYSCDSFIFIQTWYGQTCADNSSSMNALSQAFSFCGFFHLFLCHNTSGFFLCLCNVFYTTVKC